MPSPIEDIVFQAELPEEEPEAEVEPEDDDAEPAGRGWPAGGYRRVDRPAGHPIAVIISGSLSSSRRNLERGEGG